MYIPKYFKIDDQEVIYDFIDKNGFATLFSQHKGEPYATHIPLILNESKTLLYGHFARPNNQWKDITNQQVLAIFHGPHCYISPTYYETTKAVPTWNYVSVHVYGQVEIIEEKEVIYHSLNGLVNKYEAPDSDYDLYEVDSSFIDGMSKGIVAFKLNINKIEAKAKLSQNHPIERQQLIIKQLKEINKDDNKEIAALMEKNLINSIN